MKTKWKKQNTIIDCKPIINIKSNDFNVLYAKFLYEILEKGTHKLNIITTLTIDVKVAEKIKSRSENILFNISILTCTNYN